MSRAQLTSTVEQNTGGAVAPFLAGKNKIINGDFGIWQRGTSFTNPLYNQYTADRWRNNNYDVAPTTYSISQVVFDYSASPAADKLPISGYSATYFYRSTLTTIGSNTVYDTCSQRIEGIPFSNQQVTLSFWAKSDSTRTQKVSVQQNFGSGGSGDSGIILLQTFSTTTSWQRFTITGTAANMAGNTVGTNPFLYIFFRQASVSGSILDIWGVQVEAGSVATPFTTATGTLSGELQACQRYYYAAENLQTFSSYSTSTSYLISNVRYPVTMRTSPSVSIGSNSGLNYVRVISTGAQQALTVSSYPGTGPTGFSAVYAAAAPFTANIGYDFYITASAEL